MREGKKRGSEGKGRGRNCEGERKVRERKWEGKGR